MRHAFGRNFICLHARLDGKVIKIKIISKVLECHVPVLFLRTRHWNGAFQSHAMECPCKRSK